MSDPNDDSVSGAATDGTGASGPADAGDVARRFLDLWQDHVAMQMTDPAWGEMIRSFMGPAMPGARAYMPDGWTAQGQPARQNTQGQPARRNATGQPARRDASAEDRDTDGRDAATGAADHRPGHSSPPGAEAAAAAPDDDRASLDGLERRLAALEGRLASLERALLERADGRARGGLERGRGRRRR